MTRTLPRHKVLKPAHPYLLICDVCGRRTDRLTLVSWDRRDFGCPACCEAVRAFGSSGKAAAR
jgi:hypothetical protein